MFGLKTKTSYFCPNIIVSMLVSKNLNCFPVKVVRTIAIFALKLQKCCKITRETCIILFYRIFWKRYR